jgi:hypothetical protein
MDVDYLPNRLSVIERTNELLKHVKHEWIGMGRTAAWIKLPEFASAINVAHARGAKFKVVVFFEGDANKHAESWENIGAQVRYFEHGYIRLLLFDHSDAIVAFPKVVTSLLEDRDYFGYHITDERSVSELRNYFNQIWEQAEKLSTSQDESKERLRIGFAAGVLRFIIRVVKRAFPEWF